MNVFAAILTFTAIIGGLVYAVACITAFVGHAGRSLAYSDDLPTVSVIVAARNEENTIGPLIDDLLVQDYPYDRFTITVIDDCSTDDTADVVRQYAACHSRLQLLSSNDSLSPYTHKKKAIHTGILATDGEIVMTVDADCRVPHGWIRGMVRCFAERVNLVAGEIHVEGNGVPASLEILEFTGIQMMAAGLMNAGLPITCNGANLAYRRSAFDRVGGYDGYGRVVSGDDDLLMQKMAKYDPHTAVFVTGGETAVRVRANDSIGAFLHQRTRWASKIGTYPSKRALILLVAFYLFLAALPLWIVAAASGALSWTPLIVGFGLKITGDTLLVGTGLAERGLMGPLVFFPLAELLHVPYILYVAPRGLFGSFEWRGRRVRVKV